jgi:prophage regulatory protein
MASDRLIRQPEVSAITGKDRITIWRDEREGRFPNRVKIGKRAIAWHESEILAWVKSRPRSFGKA